MSAWPVLANKQHRSKAAKPLLQGLSSQVRERAGRRVTQFRGATTPICSLYPLLEITAPVAEEKQRTRPCFHHSNSESASPALLGFTASSYLHHPAAQCSCLVADAAERRAYSPSTIAGHRLTSLFKLPGAAKIWPHAFFLPFLSEGSRPEQRSSSDCQQQYWWCPSLSRQQFCTCLGQWKKTCSDPADMHCNKVIHCSGDGNYFSCSEQKRKLLQWPLVTRRLFCYKSNDSHN